MIKVNLLQNRASSTARTQIGGVTGTGITAGTATEFLGGTAATGYTTSGANNRGLLVNVGAFLVIPGALIFYEHTQLESYRQQANVVQAEVNSIRSEIDQKKNEIAQAGDLKEKAKELANKIDILKKLSRVRLREIKALDYIQTSIPEKVWLRELSFKSGGLLIRGYSMTDDDLTTFVRTIEKNRSFANVVLLQAKEERTKDGSVKNFEVSCSVEAE